MKGHITMTDKEIALELVKLIATADSKDRYSNIQKIDEYAVKISEAYNTILKSIQENNED